MLHHHVESIVTSCLESNNKELIDHLFEECKFLEKLLAADENPYAPDSHAEVVAGANRRLGTSIPARDVICLECVDGVGEVSVAGIFRDVSLSHGVFGPVWNVSMGMQLDVTSSSTVPKLLLEVNPGY